MQMNLSKNFPLSEMLKSTKAQQLGIKNIPTEGEIEQMRLLAVNILQPLRDVVGPVIISSGFRNGELNRAVGGSSTSQHRFGQAADIVIRGMSVADVCALVHKLKLPFDQMIDEKDGDATWTHISYGPRHRRQHLKARRNAAGRMVYSPA